MKIKNAIKCIEDIIESQKLLINEGSREDLDFFTKSVLEDIQKDIKALEFMRSLIKAHHIDEYHEDLGDVLWWKFPIQESPYLGSTLDVDFPKDMTHFTKIIVPERGEGD